MFVNLFSETASISRHELSAQWAGTLDPTTIFDHLGQNVGPSYREPTAHDEAIASCPLCLSFFSTELESGVRGGRSFGFGGDLTCEELRGGGGWWGHEEEGWGGGRSGRP